MMVELQTDAAGVQLTLTSFLIGVAAGQLGFGPLSDRFGRKPPLIWGTALCLAASAVAVLAPNVTILIAARFLQGLAGAAGMVIGRAIVSDLATGKAATRAYNLMSVVGGIAPVIAALLGGILVDTLGWRGILGILVGLAALMLIAVTTVVRESRPTERRAVPEQQHSANGAALVELRSRIFAGNALVYGFSFSVMMAYMAASPFLYQVMMGVDAFQYGLFFGVNALGLLAGSSLAVRLSVSHPVRQTLGIGLALVLAAALVLFILVLAGAPSGWLSLPIFVAVSSLGLVFGNATPLAMRGVPRVAGTGSALLGALQFGLGASVSPLVGIDGPDTAFPLAVVMLTSAAIAALAFLCSRPPQQHLNQVLHCESGKTVDRKV